MSAYCMIKTAAYRKGYQFFTSIGEEFGFDALAQFLAWIGVADQNQYTEMANEIALHEAESMKEIVSVESLAKTSETFSHIDLTTELEKITVPVMLLIGDSGRVGRRNPHVEELVKEFQEQFIHRDQQLRDHRNNRLAAKPTGLECGRIMGPGRFVPVETLWVDESVHGLAHDLWVGIGRSNLSFVDCISFTLMRRHEMEKVYAFDKHFAEQGFKILMESRIS